ncbi:MAG: hypothetical protein PHU45_05025 [Bacilli bacterium]|nr:hypothetical protein [Bacilli bacterium]
MLGIELVTTSVPTGKAHIERENGTLLLLVTPQCCHIHSSDKYIINTSNFICNN